MEQVNAKTYSSNNRYKVLLNTPKSIQQDIYIHGKENNIKFKSATKVIKCSNISIDIEPDFIELDTTENIPTLNSENIRVSFTTFDFVPSKMYVLLSSYPTNNTNYGFDDEIRDFRLIRGGRTNKIFFNYPQNGLKLSDILDLTKIKKSQSITLTVVLESVDNFNVTTSNIKNSYNLFKNFSSTFKILKKDDITIERTHFLGYEDQFGKINATFKSYVNSFIKVQQYSHVYDKTNNITSLTFENPQLNENFIKNTKLQFNDKYNIHQNSTLLAIDKNTLKYDRYLISESNYTKENNIEKTELKLSEDIYDLISNKDLILTNFFPSHYIIKSQSQITSKEYPVKIIGYNYNKIVISNVELLEHIYSDSNIYVEFIDNKTTNYSINKKIGIDKSEISDKYIDDDSPTEISQDQNILMVNLSFFKNFKQDVASNMFIFWNPIPIKNGMLNTQNKFYIKIEANKEIAKLEGWIRVGQNKSVFDLKNQTYVESSPDNTTKSIIIDMNNSSVSPKIEKDYIYYDLTITDVSNSIKHLSKDYQG